MSFGGRGVVIAGLSLIIFVVAPWRAQAAFNVESLYSGRLVKSAENTAVYYIGPDQKRHAFPNANVYFSWYENFSKVEVISDFELAMYPLGQNVLYRPGRRLVKISDVPEVYAVEPGGVLRNIPSEEVAIALYGPRWADLVDDLDISFFFDYDIGGVIDIVDEKPLYPRGTYLNVSGESFVVDKTPDGLFWLRPFYGNGANANGFSDFHRVSVDDLSLFELYNVGLPIILPEAGYACPACAAHWMLDDIQSYLRHTSPDGLMSVRIPEGWGSAFYSESTPGSPVFEATEIITGEGGRFEVTPWVYGGGEDISSLRDRVMDQRFVIASQRYYSGVDTVVYFGDDQDEQTRVYSTTIVKGPLTFYEVRFSAPVHLWSRYRQTVREFISSFEVQAQ